MKKLLLVLLIAIVASCTKADLTIQKQVIINLDELKEYVLPPKLNTTPVIINRIKKTGDISLSPPPPPGWCASYPEDCQLWDTLVFNGPDKINVVFIAEGWTNFGGGDEVGPPGYNKRVDSLITGLFSYEPFKSNENQFNFFTYRTFGYNCNEPRICDEGITVLAHPTNEEVEDIRYTPWRVFRNYAGLPRYTHLPDDKRQQLYDDLIKPPNGYLKNKQVYAVILSSGEVFAGSGEFPKMFGNNQKMSVTIITKSTEPPYNGLMIKLFVHEFGGHSFGDLDDEYVDSTFVNLAPIYDPIVWNYPDRLNVTDDNINNRKWDFLANPEYIPGARYVEDKYRSTDANMMRYINKSFSELNQIIIEDRILNQ